MLLRALVVALVKELRSSFMKESLDFSSSIVPVLSRFNPMLFALFSFSLLTFGSPSPSIIILGSKCGTIDVKNLNIFSKACCWVLCLSLAIIFSFHNNSLSLFILSKSLEIAIWLYFICSNSPKIAVTSFLSPRFASFINLSVLPCNK
ncbi:Hsf1p [Saccharomyces cerevisiae AWRI796]|nr:Hsf1p [Saccharomyces cerevisiae AWRI796]EGA86761.1 Hsf1p [Saccharomyces cerevisiae VL3]